MCICQTIESSAREFVGHYKSSTLASTVVCVVKSFWVSGIAGNTGSTMCKYHSFLRRTSLI
jgi:hypothetical protein